jgi:HK97 family phage major capsid protein
MADINEKLEGIARAFEEFKSKNDSVIAAEIKGATADVVRKEEVDRINAAISDMQEEVKSAKRELLAGKVVDAAAEAQSEYKTAFLNWTRKGERYEEEVQRKGASLNTVTANEGGVAVPEELDRAILDLIKQISPFRSVANIVTVSTPDYKKLVNVRGTASGWVGETASRPTTTAPELREIAPPVGEIYANIAATQRMLDDAFFNVEAWIASEIAAEFAKAEGSAFISGNGTNQPRGFLSATVATSGDATRLFGELQMIKTGVAGGFIATTTSANPADTFIDTIMAMKSELRAGAVWGMNSLTQAAVRKFKDADGAYIWRPGMMDSQPATILGYAVVEMPDMPDVATNTLPVAFGNFQRGYTIVDRVNTTLLRDPYTNKPFVQFYALKRVGGTVIDSEAIKLIGTRV